MVKMDFEARPLPEIPLPNDIATRHSRVTQILRVFIGMQSGMQDWILGIVLSRPNKHAAPGSTGGSSRRRGTSSVAVAQKDSRITDYINVRQRNRTEKASVELAFRGLYNVTGLCVQDCILCIVARSGDKHTAA